MKILVLPLVALSLAFTPSAVAADAEGSAARVSLSQEAREKFKARDWAWLEKTAHELRSTRARLPDGRWKLPSFYSGLDPDDTARTPEDWTAHFVALDAWRDAVPQSVTEAVARGKALTSWAWRARGGGWASTVADEGWKDFAARLQQARSVLEKAGKFPGRCPHWYSVMQTVALGQQWEREEYDALCQRATAAEPTYYDYYFSRAYYLQPKWHGREGEWLTDLERATREEAKGEGMTVYARTVWGRIGNISDVFGEGGVDWQMMKQGFRDMERTYPDSSWNLNHFCRFAALAGDRETTRELIDRIGDAPDLAAWEGMPGKFRATRMWALAKEAIKPRATFTTSNDAAMRCVAFSPDGKVLAGGDRRGVVVLWRLDAGDMIGAPEPAGDHLGDIAFSPDGKFLAVAWGSTTAKTKTKGAAVIYKAATGEEVARIADWRQGAMALAFTRDSTTLVITGGAFAEIGEVRTWDAATGKVQRIERNPPHKHCFDALAVSPDGRVLATECARTLDLVDLATQKDLLPARPDLKSRINGLAFSPDGLLLAAASGPAWEERQKPGRLLLCDTAGWKPRADGWRSPSGLTSVAFAPDGRWVVAGGMDGVVRLWDAATGEELPPLFGHGGYVYDVAVSFDGRCIASASLDGRILVWDAPAAK